MGIYKDYNTVHSYADRKSVGLGKQQFTAITKPAALTGELDVSCGKLGEGSGQNPSFKPEVV